MWVVFCDSLRSVMTVSSLRLFCQPNPLLCPLHRPPTYAFISVHHTWEATHFLPVLSKHGYSCIHTWMSVWMRIHDDVYVKDLFQLSIAMDQSAFCRGHPHLEHSWASAGSWNLSLSPCLGLFPSLFSAIFAETSQLVISTCWYTSGGKWWCLTYSCPEG